MLIITKLAIGHDPDHFHPTPILTIVLPQNPFSPLFLIYKWSFSKTFLHQNTLTFLLLLCNGSEKERALLGNSVNTFLRKQDAHNNTVTMETGVFSVGSAQSLL
jgi:hypothetical protein